ncbi:MAG: hypothetical protein PHI18_07575 [bacterium]|nr:hypothetical protein [bacterium]
MRKPFFRLMLAVAVWLPLAAFADEPWLLSFPQIRHDARLAYFSSDRWTAVYLPTVANLTTVPTDSLDLPAERPPAIAGEMWGLYYRIHGAGLLEIRGFSDEEFLALPPPTPDAVDCLPRTPARPIHEPALLETTGPMVAQYQKVWFGLHLRDTVGGAEAAAIGWYDPALERFGRLYTSSLSGYRPFWIGARGDSIYLIANRYEYGVATTSRMISVSAANGGTSEISLNTQDLPGTLIVAADQWGDTLLLATDRAACVWKPNRRPQAWESRAYASPTGCWIYWKTFPGGDPDAGEAVQFQSLRGGVPSDVRAKVGRWYQVIAPAGIEGFVNPYDWAAHQGEWSDWKWNCDSPCFARLNVPMQGRMTPGDLMNVMLTYLGEDERGVKVGFQAGWVREEDIAPIMMSTTPPRESE